MQLIDQFVDDLKDVMFHYKVINWVRSSITLQYNMTLYLEMLTTHIHIPFHVKIITITKAKTINYSSQTKKNIK